MGKYQTTFYNKSGSAFQSSVVGGVVTIIALILVGLVILKLLIDVFSQEHHNLDIQADIINAYRSSELFHMDNELAPCTDPCTDIYFRDIESIFSPGLNLTLFLDYFEENTTKCEEFIADYDITGFNGTFVNKTVTFQYSGVGYCEL